MRGLPLEHQLLTLGATFEKECETAPKYRMYVIDGPIKKPGMIQDEQGSALRAEVYRIPVDNLGRFLMLIPAPLCLGSVELSDGTKVIGFLCESYAVKDCEEITRYQSWRTYIEKNM